ncbi:hypothetical protein GCM10023085_77050 [Actinomadura viridis]|uniref:DprA winged helix domain-containing protein n=1 Tax=Actinomadura viridis TaxID=58110 RepID=A0A931DJM1_9ACTN|nr:hypothetical protein [Actinomadura viridis]MBG6088200.1 hypothetical protein [Actinomadura viridis]
MRQIRSADPWSTFLSPSGRDPGSLAAARAQPSGPRPDRPGHGDAPDDADLPEACRLVLGRLGAAGGALTLEQLHHATGLGLLEVADAVEKLLDRGLVSVRREVDELVRLTGPDGGPAE